MDAVTIGAVAALLTAAAGLAKILASKDTEKPWVVGVVTLGIVGGVLLLVGRSPPPPPPPSPAPAPAPAPAPSPSLQEYQRQVRAVCAEDREAEVGFKHRTEGIQRDVMTGNLSALASLISAMTDVIVKEQGLAGRLGALNAPSTLEPVQSEAVATWNRKLAVSREIRDQLAHKASDPVGLAEAMAHASASQESQLESEKDDLLRRLGGPGCDPSP